MGQESEKKLKVEMEWKEVVVAYFKVDLLSPVETEEKLLEFLCPAFTQLKT
jgi:hypothetical protein